MFTLRRASLHLRKRSFNVRVSSVKLMPTTRVQYDAGIICVDSPKLVSGSAPFSSLNRCYHSGHGSKGGFSIGRRELSSQAGENNTKDEDDDLKEGVSVLETPKGDEGEQLSDSDTELSDDSYSDSEEFDDSDSDRYSDSEESETEHSDDIVREDSDAELCDDSASEDSDIEDPRNEQRSDVFKAIMNGPFKAIMNDPGLSIKKIMKKWEAKKRNHLDNQGASRTIFNLLKLKMYARALEFSEWLERNQWLSQEEAYYATRLDLIAKVHGLYKAEAFIESIPESFRGDLIYRSLLDNCVTQNNLKKAEEILNKMKDLGFPITVFMCNQLLHLYKRSDKKKLAGVLLLMVEHENDKPSSLTFKFLIDAKGHSKDIDGMDQIVDKMKAEGIELDIQTKAVLVGHYISAGLADKAKTLLKEMEGENLKENLWVCPVLLPLYANLGMADEVGRVWKVCEIRPWIEECLAAIKAWGKLKNVDEAEAVFEMMSKKWKLTPRNCSVLLKVYANNNMLMKGKDLIQRMADSGCQIGPVSWDALVKLYVQAGEVENADSVLQKAVHESQVKPLYSSYITIMEQYAERGDINNTEKIFHRMKQAGYVSRLRQYQFLIGAYVNAKVPAYGMRDRLKADNVFPNRNLADMLIQVDELIESS